MGDPVRTQAFVSGQLGFQPGQRVAVDVPGAGLRYVRAEELSRAVGGGALIASEEERAQLDAQAEAARLDEGAAVAAVHGFSNWHGGTALVDALGFEAEAEQLRERAGRAQARHPTATMVGEGAGLLADVASAVASGGLYLGAGATRLPTAGQVASRVLTPGGLGVASRELVGAGTRRLLLRAGLRRGTEFIPAVLGEAAEAGTVGAAYESIRRLNADEELSGEAAAAAFGVNAFYGGILAGGYRGLRAGTLMLAQRSRATGMLGDAAGVRAHASRLSDILAGGDVDGAFQAYRRLEAEVGPEVARGAWDRAIIAQARQVVDPTPEGLAQLGRQLAPLDPADPAYRRALEGRASSIVRRIGEVTTNPSQRASLGILSRPDERRLGTLGHRLAEGSEDAARAWNELDDLVSRGIGGMDELAIRRGLIPDGPLPLSVRNSTSSVVRQTREGVEQALTAVRQGAEVLDELPVMDRRVGAVLRGGLEVLAGVQRRIRTKGITGPQAYRLLNEAKRKLQSAVRAVAEDTRVPRDEAAAVQHLYSSLAGHLENAAVWGERAANLQRAGNAAFSRSIAQQEQLAKMLGTTTTATDPAIAGRVPSRRMRIDGQRVQDWMLSYGNPERANAAGRVELEAQEYLMRLGDLDEAIRAVGGESDLAARANRLTARLGLLRTTAEAVAATRRATTQAGGPAGGSLMASLVTGGVLGHIVGGPATAAASMAGRALWQAATHPAQVLVFFGGVEQAAARVAGRLEGGFGALRRASTSGLPQGMPRVPSSMAVLFTADREAREEHYNELVDEVRRLRGNPQELLERLGHATGPMEAAGDSGMAREAAMTAIRAIELMYSKIPPEPPPSPFRQKRHRSEAEMDGLLRTWWAVNDPLAILHMAAAGRVFPEHAEAVRLVYPRLHMEISTRLLGELQGRTKPLELPYWLRLSVGQVLGTPVDTSETPDFIAAMQQRAAQTPTMAQTLGMGHQPAVRPGRTRVQETYPTGADDLEEAL